MALIGYRKFKLKARTFIQVLCSVFVLVYESENLDKQSYQVCCYWTGAFKLSHH